MANAKTVFIGEVTQIAGIAADVAAVRRSTWERSCGRSKPVARPGTWTDLGVKVGDLVRARGETLRPKGLSYKDGRRSKQIRHKRAEESHGGERYLPRLRTTRRFSSLRSKVPIVRRCGWSGQDQGTAVRGDHPSARSCWLRHAAAAADVPGVGDVSASLF